MFPTGNYRGETHCLRTGERCQTLLRGDCPQRPTARDVTTSSFEMPRLPADPLPILTGRAHQVVTGGCDSTFDLDLELKRTGD